MELYLSLAVILGMLVFSVIAHANDKSSKRNPHFEWKTDAQIRWEQTEISKGLKEMEKYEEKYEELIDYSKDDEEYFNDYRY